MHKEKKRAMIKAANATVLFAFAYSFIMLAVFYKNELQIIRESEPEASEIVITATPEPTATPAPTLTATPTPTPELTATPIPTPVITLSETDKVLLKRLAMAEMEGESLEAKALAINVVLNRVESPKFPDTIHDVIFQVCGKAYQFSPIKDGRWEQCKTWNAECDEALEMVIYGWDESQDALYFRTITTKQNWHDANLEWLFDIDDTRFYK